MAGDDDFTPFRVTLAHEELAYLTGLLGVQPAIGVDDDPLAGRPPEQVALALAVAGRALQARALVQAGAGRQATVQSALLAIIGAYAFPERLVTLFHWASGEAVPSACYGYVREHTVVLHGRPAPMLHEFSQIDTTPALVDQLLAFCGAGRVTGLAAHGWQVPAAALAQARDMVRRGQREAAVALLAQGAEKAAVERFVRALAGAAVTLFTTLRMAHGAIDRREFTLLAAGAEGWLLTAAEGFEERMAVQPTDSATLQAMLAGALAVGEPV